MPTMLRAAAPARSERGASRIAVGLALVFPFLVAGGIIAWKQFTTGCVTLNEDTIGAPSFGAPPCPFVSDDLIYFMEMRTDAGPIRLALDPILACDTVNNLVFLARAGFYDGIAIHRVEVTEDHAFVQIGDPTGTGRGTPGYTYTAEPPSPITRYTRGTAAMVFAGDDPTTAGSQFFIVVRDFDTLSYPAREPVNTLFGGVPDQASLDTLDRIVALPLMDGHPARDVVIHGVQVTEQRRFGEEGEETRPCAGGLQPLEGDPEGTQEPTVTPTEGDAAEVR